MADPVRRVLVAGASGVIGTAAVEHFAGLSGWDVIALSRRPPVVAQGTRFDHVAADLSDPAACTVLTERLPPITHLIYAAVAEAPGLVAGWRDEALMAVNGAMFANILAPVARSGTLQHVSILQGAKAYGAHVHPVTVPLREAAPRDPHANFYWLHEDMLRETASQHGFGFTIFRPQVVLGWAPGAAMNPVAAIGAYAALCKDLGKPFALPGTSAALWEMADAGLLAQALAWAATDPAAAGENFNLTNGDVFVLRHAWPVLADMLGLPGESLAPETFSSLFSAPESQQAWSAIARRHGLIEPSLSALLGQSATYLDLLLASRIADKASPTLLSTIKLRQAGFAACRDSLESLVGQLRKMAELRLLPPLFG
ncbi:NAD-dependent epimerase/dehydratase family protein [Novosphingobium sp. G106]|uniref:NAD-dependent epimerase/dehydratase family protein n=1 Tax=Novosphingobium sp. G106 TaxID=2849500 RepID=UPI001C2CF07C|nr:NAD-dependent epimerase/dehydratase family protein [Novosphingobium sp. G106]MBV1687326.1 NAD-dependent epimerase/dehydratase family protein [Novosphingobium sp. G106]